jgi:hypothetical protein
MVDPGARSGAFDEGKREAASNGGRGINTASWVAGKSFERMTCSESAATTSGAFFF